MAASFPESIKTFSTKSDGVDKVYASHVNDIQNEVTAIETELKKTTGSVVDHGALTGLGDNDHPQYVLASANGQWASYTPVWTASTTNPTLGDGSLTGRYCVVGKLCTMSVRLNIGSTTTLGTGNWAFSIPLPVIAGGTTAPVYIGTAHCRNTGTMSYVLAVYLEASVSTTKTAYFVQDSTNSLNLTPTAPFAWATGDILTFEITYELA